MYEKKCSSLINWNRINRSLNGYFFLTIQTNSDGKYVINLSYYLYNLQVKTPKTINCSRNRFLSKKDQQQSIKTIEVWRKRKRELPLEFSSRLNGAVSNSKLIFLFLRFRTNLAFTTIYSNESNGFVTIIKARKTFTKLIKVFELFGLWRSFDWQFSKE